MAFSAGSIVGKLGLDTSGFGQGILQAQGIASVFPGVISNFIASPLLGAIDLAKQAGMALAGMLQQGIGRGVALAADFETVQVALETMLGSADAAKTVLGNLKAFASETPFEFPELANASRKLIAFGTSADELIPTLRAVGDVSAGIQAPIGEIAEIYGKARVQQRLMMEDINQLTGRGIPIIQELAKQFGVADSAIRQMVENGRVNFSHLEKAFESLTSAGGMFAGGMERQSKTVSGMWSTVMDTINNSLAEGGVKFLEGMNAKGVMSDMIQTVEGLAPTIGQIFGDIGQMAGEVWPLVKDAVVSVVEWMGEGIAAVKPIWESLIPVFEGVWAVLKGIGDVAISGVVAQFQAWAPVLNVVGELLGGILQTVGTVLSGLASVGDTINKVMGGEAAKPEDKKPAAMTTKAAKPDNSGLRTMDLGGIPVLVRDNAGQRPGAGTGFGTGSGFGPGAGAGSQGVGTGAGLASAGGSGAGGDAARASSQAVEGITKGIQSLLPPSEMMRDSMERVADITAGTVVPQFHSLAAAMGQVSASVRPLVDLSGKLASAFEPLARVLSVASSAFGLGSGSPPAGQTQTAGTLPPGQGGGQQPAAASQPTVNMGGVQVTLDHHAATSEIAKLLRPEIEKGFERLRGELAASGRKAVVSGAIGGA